MFLAKLRTAILGIVDFFYPPFSRYIGIQTFRYLILGGSNALLNLVVFALSYHFIFRNETIYILNIETTRYIAAYIIALSVSFPVGFCLNKYIVFQQSNLKGTTQLFRYGFLTVLNIYLDYSLLHFLVGYMGYWPTPSQAFIIVLLSFLSYLYQTYFTFRTK